MDKAKNKQKKLYTKTIIVNTGIIFTLPDFYAHINLFSFKKKKLFQCLYRQQENQCCLKILYISILRTVFSNKVDIYQNSY